MARQRKRADRGRQDSNTSNSGYKPRRDWQQTAFYVLSVMIVLSMVCALFAQLL